MRARSLAMRPRGSVRPLWIVFWRRLRLFRRCLRAPLLTSPRLAWMRLPFRVRRVPLTKWQTRSLAVMLAGRRWMRRWMSHPLLPRCYLSGRGFCLADLVLSQPLPSPAASVGYLSSRGFCLADLVLSQLLPSPAASAFFGGDAGGSEADAPVDEPSPAASVGYLSGRGFCHADLVLSHPLPSPAASLGYLSSRGFCLADLVLSQPLPSRQSVASVRVCYLSCHVFALPDGRSPAVVVVPDSCRCANISCARLLVQRALGSGG
jgi:hypothetical protein